MTRSLAGVSGIAPGHPAAPATLPRERPLDVAGREDRPGESELIELDGWRIHGSADRCLARAARRRRSWCRCCSRAARHWGSWSPALNRHRRFDDGYRGFVELVAGHIAAGVGSARSYQAQQQRAEALAELDRAKTAFFSNVSHEFRTPLTLILGPVDELRGRTTGVDEQARQELELIHRNGLRLAKLVNTLLDFSRIQAGRMQAHFEPADLASITAELASVFRSAIDRAGLTFTVDCPPLDQPVHLDREMWEKVVLNLLSNALKFTFEGSITVRVGREDTESRSSQLPTPGSEYLPRRCRGCSNVSTASRTHAHGPLRAAESGWRLVKELVGLHGGTITADSQEGVGTTFTVRLPFGAAHLPTDELARAAGHPRDLRRYRRTVRAGSAALATRRQQIRSADDGDDGTCVTPAESDGERARVLIADDNADMREYLTNLLRTAGYKSVKSPTASRRSRPSAPKSPTCVISDVMMPGLDGLQLLAALRRDPRTAAVPVLLLSARAGQEASIEGLQAGADDYLVKPFAAAELLARVRANIELARLRSHHARWRTALVDSLQEAFFVCDEHGAVIEINAAFAEILGYGPEQLPYQPTHPWWPDAETDPEAYRQVETAFAGLLSETRRAPSRFPSTTATGTGCGSRPTSTTPKTPTPDAGSWSAPCATSRPSTTPCNARPRWPRSISNWLKPTRSTTRCTQPPRNCAGCGTPGAFWP